MRESIRELVRIVGAALLGLAGYLAGASIVAAALISTLVAAPVAYLVGYYQTRKRRRMTAVRRYGVPIAAAVFVTLTGILPWSGVMRSGMLPAWSLIPACVVLATAYLVGRMLGRQKRTQWREGPYVFQPEDHQAPTG